MEEHETVDPLYILCFSTDAVMAQSDLRTHLVEQSRFRGGFCQERRAAPEVRLSDQWGVFMVSESLKISRMHQWRRSIHRARTENTPAGAPTDGVIYTEVGVH